MSSRRGVLAGAVFLALALAMGGSAMSAPIPELPKDLHIVDTAGAQIAPPSLQVAGPPLIVSNSPEVIPYAYPAALYRTLTASDHFRVFYHHQNGAGETLKIGIAITNPSKATRPIEVYVRKNSQLLPKQHKRTVDFSPRIAGERALQYWSISPSKEAYLCTLAPGKTYYILQDVPNGATTTGMHDFGVRNAKAGVYVTAVTCTSAPPDPTVLHILTPDRLNDGWYRRGVFPHSDRMGCIECDASRVSWLDIAGPEYGRHARPMKNETEAATDDPDGRNPGNYGAVYSFHVVLKNPTSEPLKVRCLLNAAGGASSSLVTVNGAFAASGRALSAYDSWVCREVTIAPNKTSDFMLDFSLPGGSNGAHRLYFWPEDKRMASTTKTLNIQL